MEKQKSLEASKSNRRKIPEKVNSESHRRYLDMDTDEEELGYQEAPEDQDDAPSEPDRPEFTDEELDALIQRTRDLTVLPGLSESSWTESCLERIREYFCDPSKLILTIFFHDNELRALLDFPKVTDNGLAYFLRKPRQIYRPGDFLTFGNVGERTESSVLRIVEGLYAPLVFKNEWPEIRKDKIFSNIHDLLARATEATYKPLGMLILYLPLEGTRIQETKQSSEIESIIGSKYLNEQRLHIDRLEKVMWTWIKQIREALIIIPSSLEKLYDTTSEFDFWKSRYDKLACLSIQLKNDRFLSIINQFKGLRSSNIKKLKMLGLKVDKALEEAESNLIYLNVLLENCNTFIDPGKVHDCLPEILHTVRFIWNESPYYNVSENIERLLCSLSVYIVKMCINNIDLKLMFEDVKKCHETVQINLSCLLSYSRIYDRTIGNCMENKDNWRVNKTVVFKRVDAFEQRCRDISEICDAIKIYGSSHKVNFGGTRGSYHEMQHRRVKDYFSEIMNEMQIRCNYALDITETKWFQDMSTFRNEVDELENTMKNILNSLFEDAVSVEMAIEMLYTIFKFKERRCFADILRNKWMQVWQMFSEEVKLCSKETPEYEICQDEIKFLKSENSIISCVHKNYLKRLYKMMINASDWLGDCHLQFEAPLINFSRKISI